MSKSGVFAHFGSREELQISVIREYHRRFEEEVFFPAMREPRGLPRLRALFERWMRRVSVEVDSGCIYISGAVEFDDRPGPVRDALVGMVRAWQDALERAIRIAVDEGQLRPTPTPTQMLFEMHGLILALHHDARFLRTPGAPERARPAFERVVIDSLSRRRGCAAQAAPLTPFLFPGAFSHAPVHPAVARHAVRAARTAERRRRTEDAAAPHGHRRRHHQRGARGRRQVRRRGDLPAEHQRRRRGLHARQGHARGAARPTASRTPMRSTSKAAGRRWSATPSTAARACRSC